MAKIRWEIKLGVILALLSAFIYLLHFTFFHDMHHILIYLVGDIAFVPIEVLMVTVIIHRLLEIREKRRKLEKMNIVIGAFFSEIGTDLLTRFSDTDPNLDRIREFLIVENDWDDDEFNRADLKLREYEYEIDIEKIDLKGFRHILVKKRGFLVRLLENPMLLEHEAFTNLLQAVFHAMEELENRRDIGNLPETDKLHLRGDLIRSYSLLVDQWLDYMRHLQGNYPYLFSLAMRLNPFDLESDPVVNQ